MASFNEPRDASGAIDQLYAQVERLKAQQAELAAATKQVEQAAVRAARAARQGEVGAARPALGRAAAGEDIYAAARGRTVPTLTNDLQRLSQIQQVSSEQMRRHGALTTEFLSGLARGEVTLSDFGYHISGTIGKFAGWTAAAGAVYGALGAIKELGTGARDAASGTDQLQRFLDHVDTGKAQQGFRDVSRELNVPIKEVADAQAQFARIFKNQDESLQAARISLLATKIDNVDTAASYRFLTGIVQEFQLPASRLPLLFDQISAAQRRAGGRVAELLPAVARSAAAVKNAGGDLSQLIALANTAQVASGQTGQSVGTAFYRAPRFVAKNAEVLKSQFGLDPNEGFTQFLIDATKKAQELQPRMRRILAEAIGGPQLGDRIFAPLLNRYQLLQKSLGATDPAHAQGSAQEELRHKLAQVDEQLKAVGNNLQRLGSALVQSGAFTSLGLFLRLLNDSLGAVTKLVEVFDKLPEPLRQALVVMLELRAATAFLRGTQLGAAVASRIPGGGLVVNQADRNRLTAIAGLRTREESLAARSTAAAAAGITTSEDVALAQQRQRSLALARTSATTDVERAAINKEMSANEARILELKAQQLAAEKQSAEFEQLRSDAEAQRLAIKRRENVILGESAALTAEGTAATEAGAVASAENAAARTTQAEAQGLNALGTARGGMGFAMKALNVALIGYLGGTALADLMKESGKHIADVSRQLSDQALSTKDLEAQQKYAKSQAGPQDFLDQAADFLASNARGTVLGNVGSVYNAATGRDVLGAAAAASQRANQTERGALRRTINSTVQIVDDNLSDLQNRLKDDISAVQHGQITRAEFNRRVAVLQRSASASLEAVAGNAKAVRDFQHQTAIDAAHALDPTKADPFSQFKADTQPKDTLSFLQRRVDLAQISGRNPPYQALARGLVYATEKFHSAQSPQNLKDLLSAQALFDDTLTKDVQDNLKAALATATSPGQRQAAYRRAIAEVNRGRNTLYGGLAEGRQSLDVAERRLRSLQAQQQREAGGTLAGEAGRERAGGGVEPGLSTDQRIQATKDRIAKLRSAYKSAQGAVAKRERDLADLLLQLKQQEFSDYQSNVDIQAAYRESQTNDKVEQVKIAIAADEQVVEEAIKLFGAHSKEALQAITKANQDRNRLVEEQRTRLVSENALNTARILERGTSGDQARARSQLAGLYRVLAFDRAHNADVATINQDLTEIFNARRQLADQVQKDAKDLYDARLEAQIAATDDPIRKAKLELQRDTHDLAGLSGADYYRQLAKVREDRFKVRDAKLQDQEDELAFLHDTAQIDDQQYIDALTQILNTKKLSRDARRKLQKQIYDLQNKDTGQLELNVDNIKLPSIYQVRRALAEGGGQFAQTNVGVTQTNQINIPIQGAKEGIREFARTMDDLLGSSVESGLRAAGII